MSLKKIFSFFGTKYLQFILIGAIGTITNAIVLYTLTEWLGLWYMLSFIIGAVCGSMVNFAGSKLWVFKK